MDKTHVRFTLSVNLQSMILFFFGVVSIHSIPLKWFHKFMAIILFWNYFIHRVMSRHYAYTVYIYINLKFMIVQFNREDEKKRNLNSFSLYLMYVNDLLNKNHNNHSKIFCRSHSIAFDINKVAFSFDDVFNYRANYNQMNCEFILKTTFFIISFNLFYFFIE